MDESAWYAETRDRLEAAYLAADTPQRQSGLNGDAAHWERRRSVIVEAINNDGTFLDVGCANGLLMETVVGWAAARGCRLEPYGLDISPKLAALARSRYPAWAERIFTGNIMEWDPPRRFDYVRTELVYVPPARQPALVARLLAQIVAHGGRLIVCAYRARGDRDAEPIDQLLSSWGLTVGGLADAVDDADGGVATRVIWLDTGHRLPSASVP